MAEEDVSRARRWRPGTIMRLVRRVHMVLGLLVAPWVLFFGLSGLQFNHPRVGRPITARTLGPEATKLAPWDARATAEAVTAKLGDGYALDDTTQPGFFGFPVLAAESVNGQKELLTVDLASGSAELATQEVAAKPARAPFATTVELPDRTMNALEQQFKDVLPANGVETKAPPRRTPKSAPELRFAVRDREGRVWNAQYDLRTGAVEGIPVGQVPPMAISEVLARLHKTHHYPLAKRANWFWTLCADITAATLILWALTGLAMWWQMKGWRKIGVLVVSAGLAIAALVMTGTSSENRYGTHGVVD